MPRGAARLPAWLFQHAAASRGQPLAPLLVNSRPALPPAPPRSMEKPENGVCHGLHSFKK